jgi:hypothetical protein
MSRLATLLGAIGLACLFCARVGAEEPLSADDIKCAYLFRIPGYVQWPKAWPSDAPFTIDVLGDPAVANELKQLLSGHRIQGHPARVHVIRKIAELGDAQMLYIGSQFTGDIHSVIASIGRRPVLIVTDEERGLADGSTINFVEDSEHVRVEISLTAADAAGLEISSQLLSVAARVEGQHLRSWTECPGEPTGSTTDFACSRMVLVALASGEPQ